MTSFIYFTLLVLIVVSSIETSTCQILRNNNVTSSIGDQQQQQQQQQHQNEQVLIDEDEQPISFGIKSFTIEVTKPTIKSSNVNTKGINKKIKLNVQNMKNFGTTLATTATTTEINHVSNSSINRNSDGMSDEPFSKLTNIPETPTNHPMPIITNEKLLPSSKTNIAEVTTNWPTTVDVNQNNLQQKQKQEHDEAEHEILKSEELPDLMNASILPDLNEKRENISNEPDTEQESTDERPPPASSLIFQNVDKSMSDILTTLNTEYITLPPTPPPSLSSNNNLKDIHTFTTSSSSTSSDNSYSSGSSSSDSSSTNRNDRTDIDADSNNTHVKQSLESMINDFHRDKKLKNGLYRIKLAEIITSEFNNNDGGTGGFDDDNNNENAYEIAVVSSKINEKHLTDDEFERHHEEEHHHEHHHQQQQQQQQQQYERNKNQQNKSGGKINIIDLYPSEIQDFTISANNSNEKIEQNKEKSTANKNIENVDDVEAVVDGNIDGNGHDKNMLTNSLNELFEKDFNIPSSKIDIELIDENSNNNNNSNSNSNRRKTNNNNKNDEKNENIKNNNKNSNNNRKHFGLIEKTTDLTGKLQEQDGVITEIEKKFQLDDLRRETTTTTATAAAAETEKQKQTVTETISTTKFSSSSTENPIGLTTGAFIIATATSGSNSRTTSSASINTQIIDRRVKKSFLFFDLPLSGHTSKWFDKTNEKRKRIDFGNTKFKSDSSADNKNVHSKHTESNEHAMRPEFSTTKFYNSKELYNEMLHKASNKFGMSTVKSSLHDKTSTSTTTSPEIQTYGTTLITSNTPLRPTNKMTTTIAPTIITTDRPTTATPTPTIQLDQSSTNSFNTEQTEITSDYDLISIENGKLKTESPIQQSTTQSHLSTELDSTFSSILRNAVQNGAQKVTKTISTLLRSTLPIPLQQSRTTLTRLQEKIYALECDIQNIPEDSHVWRGNETHELLLPVMAAMKTTATETTNDAADSIAAGASIEKWNDKIQRWEGKIEIQSGDVLLVEINDSLLGQGEINQNKLSHKATTQVYQVTRPGYENCDVTEGVLLDITPLVVDGKKLVTLYDKDLTEGINLLIVVSELWGSQCVRLKVTVKSDNCGENADCSGKGICFSNASMEGYECQCCSGFTGGHCEEIDACSPSPCTNNGICVDLSQGHEGNSYQCLCPYGYTGKNCQYESDPCNPAECMNGGSCVGNSTHFRCDCASGYTGPLCQHNLNECESSPCVHGICVDQENGFRCFCQPGFSGELCNFEYNECESNPCLNGGECIDQIGTFDCRCTKGFTGIRCQIKVDLCANSPCPEEHHCVDHGNDFTCECPAGRSTVDCDHLPKMQCNENPCSNGGTCWNSGETFYCACRPGYTGKLCEDEFVVETVVSSSEFMVEDSRNFNEKPFGSSVTKSPIELHNAYIAAGTLAAAIFIVAIVVTVCHCKVNQTYRRFSNRQTSSFLPIFGFGKRANSSKSHRHWLSGKNGSGNGGGSGGILTGNGNSVNNTGILKSKGHLPPGTGNSHFHHHYQQQQQHSSIANSGHERTTFQRHLAMNLENDMYYTVDFSESQNSPLMQ